jgi:hypothetical protein
VAPTDYWLTSFCIEELQGIWSSVILYYRTVDAFEPDYEYFIVSIDKVSVVLSVIAVAVSILAVLVGACEVRVVT